MKKIILSLVCVTVLACGCNKQTQSDSAKIEELSQRLDTVLQNQSVVMSNQAAIFNAVTALKSQVSLQTDYLNDQNYSYYTNLSSKIFDVQQGCNLIIQSDKWLMDMSSTIATNLNK